MFSLQTTRMQLKRNSVTATVSGSVSVRFPPGLPTVCSKLTYECVCDVTSHPVTRRISVSWQAQTKYCQGPLASPPLTRPRLFLSSCDGLTAPTACPSLGYEIPFPSYAIRRSRHVFLCLCGKFVSRNCTSRAFGFSAMMREHQADEHIGTAQVCGIHSFLVAYPQM
jgi:hypothetical protein